MNTPLQTHIHHRQLCCLCWLWLFVWFTGVRAYWCTIAWIEYPLKIPASGRPFPQLLPTWFASRTAADVNGPESFKRFYTFTCIGTNIISFVALYFRCMPCSSCFSDARSSQIFLYRPMNILILAGLYIYYFKLPTRKMENNFYSFHLSWYVNYKSQPNSRLS